MLLLPQLDRKATASSRLPIMVLSLMELSRNQVCEPSFCQNVCFLPLRLNQGRIPSKTWPSFPISGDLSPLQHRSFPPAPPAPPATARALIARAEGGSDVIPAASDPHRDVHVTDADYTNLSIKSVQICPNSSRALILFIFLAVCSFFFVRLQKCKYRRGVGGIVCRPTGPTGGKVKI